MIIEWMILAPTVTKMDFSTSQLTTDLLESSETNFPQLHPTLYGPLVEPRKVRGANFQSEGSRKLAGTQKLSQITI